MGDRTTTWVMVALVVNALAGCATERGAPDLADPAASERRYDTLRVVTWNIETVGAPGSAEYDAALDVVGRLDADVVALQEIADASDDADLQTFAADAGYPNVAIGTAAFGADHVAILSRRALLDVQALDAPTLSGDPAADDLTRNFLRVEVDTQFDPLVVVTNHWKCCGSDMEEFRRSVESARAAQALTGLDPAADPILVLGDMNEDTHDLPLNPGAFFALPSGLPATWWLGQDLYDQMVQVGIDNDPFAPLTDFGLVRVPATQRDGADDTFITGGTLDHVYRSPVVRLTAQEVFDDRDEGLASSLHLATAPIAAGTVATASDHHPLVVEVGVRR